MTPDTPAMDEKGLKSSACEAFSNVCLARKGDASRLMEGDVPPQRKDQSGRVDITIMMHSALDTIPTSHCETLHPFRAAEASALGTGLRGPSFVSFNIHRLPSGSLVPQHVPECRPACVQDGFSHPGLCELAGIHVADDDQTICVSQPFAGDMEMVASRVGDLGMDRSDPPFFAASLSFAKRALVLAIMAKCGNFRPVTASGERFQPEVNTDFAIASRQNIFDGALKGDVPPPARVLDESSSLEDPFNFPVLPKPHAALEIHHRTTIDTKAARNEGYPAQSPFGAEACPETWGSTLLVASCSELPADAVHRIGMQAEFDRYTSTEIIEVEGSWPQRRTSKTPPLFCFALSGRAEIPNLIASDRLPAQAFPGDAVFNPKFEGDYAHG